MYFVDAQNIVAFILCAYLFVMFLDTEFHSGLLGAADGSITNAVGEVFTLILASEIDTSSDGKQFLKRKNLMFRGFVC